MFNGGHMQTLTPAQILDLLINLTPQQIQQISELLGPCQASIDLYNALTTLQQLK